jgi:hypothetical protein
MGTEPLFVMLPYVRTQSPLFMGDIVFRSSDDAGHLTPEEGEHLKNIVSLFYFVDGRPVGEAVYVLLHLPEDRDEIESRIRQLRAAHTILGFLLTQDPYRDNYEQLSLYAVTPAKIYLPTAEFSPPVPGYSITVNWTHWCEIPQGGRLYPPEPYPEATTPKEWSLTDLDDYIGSDPLLVGFREFISGRLLARPEQVDRLETLLRAMSWHNRSHSQFDSEEEKIVHLAIAFEALLHEKDSSGIRQELQMRLRSLFGEAPRLEAWVDQFYDERSRIVHEGFASNLRFTVEKERRSGEEQLTMDSLVNYGRRLLRLCVYNILHATLLADEANLNAWFTHDEERLQSICKHLYDERIPAEQRLLSVLDLMCDLGEVWVHCRHREAVNLRTMHAAGRKFAEVCLEVHPGTTEGRIRERLEDIMSADIESPVDVVDAYSGLCDEFRGTLRSHGFGDWPPKLCQALAQFAKYASSSTFRNKAHDLVRERQQTE